MIDDECGSTGSAPEPRRFLCGRQEAGSGGGPPYPQLLGGGVVGVDALGHAPVLHGDALQEVVVHVEADAQREEGELLPHHALHVLLDGAEFDLSCRRRWERRGEERRGEERERDGCLQWMPALLHQLVLFT